MFALSTLSALIGGGVGTAFLYKVVATIAPQIHPDWFIFMGRVVMYSEAVVMAVRSAVHMLFGGTCSARSRGGAMP